jgi:hypothetical protein
MAYDPLTCSLPAYPSSAARIPASHCIGNSLISCRIALHSTLSFTATPHHHRRWTPHHMHVNVHLLSSLHLFTLVTSSFVVQLCIALQSFAPLSPAIRCTTTPHSEHRHAVLFMAPMALMFMHDSHPIPISYLDMRRDRARRIVLFIVASLMKSKTNLVQSHSIQISFHQPIQLVIYYYRGAEFTFTSNCHCEHIK